MGKQVAASVHIGSAFDKKTSLNMETFKGGKAFLRFERPPDNVGGSRK